MEMKMVYVQIRVTCSTSHGTTSRSSHRCSLLSWLLCCCLLGLGCFLGGGLGLLGFGCLGLSCCLGFLGLGCLCLLGGLGLLGLFLLASCLGFLCLWLLGSFLGCLWLLGLLGLDSFLLSTQLEAARGAGSL